MKRYSRWFLIVSWALAVFGCSGLQTPKPPTPPTTEPQSSPASSPTSQPTVAASNSPTEPALDPKLIAMDESDLKGEGPITAAELEADVKFLADDAREGRGLGTGGLEASAEHVAKRFEAAGLSPAGDAGTFFQTFEVTIGSTLTKGASLALDGKPLALDQAWRPFAFSENAALEAEVVFAGYGITAQEHGYDDYAGLDVKGKVVLVLRHEPGRRNVQSPFDGDKPSRHSDLRLKAHLARNNGAAAIIIINDPLSHATPTKDDPDALVAFKGTAQAGIPALHMTWKGAGPAFKKLGVDLQALQQSIETTGRPTSQATGKKLKLGYTIERQTAKVRNVVGVLLPEGDAELALVRHGALVVGAHYDHLGRGDEGSLRPDSTEIHNGADDNASGTALLMALAEALVQRRPIIKRRIYFVAFTAEESGLKGSQYFVEHPPVPVERLGAMVNFDMVGRLRENKLTVGGIGTAREFQALTTMAGQDLGLSVGFNRDGFGPSDHASFYAQRVPVLFFFTGAHEQYHTPEDDAPLVNIEGMRLIGRYALRVLTNLAGAEVRPLYTQADIKVAGDAGGTGSRSYGRATLGTVPSFDDTGGKGVKLQGIRPGSPADVAGIKPGDMIVNMAGKPIKDLQDMTFVLRDHKPGQIITVTVMRDGQPLDFKATLAARQD